MGRQHTIGVPVSGGRGNALSSAEELELIARIGGKFAADYELQVRLVVAAKAGDPVAVDLLARPPYRCRVLSAEECAAETRRRLGAVSNSRF
jgi:hypothetical protein